MADSKKSKENPMSMEAFRAKKAGAAGSSTSAQKTTSNQGSKLNTSATKTTGTAGQESRSRPQSASKSRAPRSRSSSVDSLNSSSIAIEARQEKVKQLRNKQIEDKKKKNDERRLAFEERKKKKEEEEKRKWDNLKQQAATQRPGSGRKLPTLPGGPKRPATAGSGPTRPTGLPKSLKTTSSSKLPGQGVAKSSAKSPAQSSSSQSSDSSPKQSPTTHGKTFLAAKRPGSGSNLLSENRRASTSNLARPSTGSKSRPLSMHGVDPKMSTSKSHNSLAPSTRTVKKAQSTSALHYIGIDKPSHHPKKHAEKQEKPKAGMLDEAAAKQALAERRKQAREEAERKAKLDLERQEVERKKKEEEDKILAEEMAIEEEKMRERAELLEKQNEEKLKKALEEKEQRDKEEEERLIAEEKQREEERKMREEEERIAKIEAVKKAKEDEERRKKEEVERQERRKRVEEIMSRTRQSKTDSPNPDSMESATTPPQELKDMDVEDTKRKVSEILQKVKDRTDSVSPVSSVDSEPSSAINTVQNVHEEQTACQPESTIDIDQGENCVKEKILGNEEMENPKPIQEVTGVASGNDSVIKVRVRISETRTEVKVNGREVQRTLSHEHVPKNEHNNGTVPSIVVESDNNQDDTSINSSGAINGHEEREFADVRQDNKENKENQTDVSTRDSRFSADEENLWKNTEALMHKTEISTCEKLENAGIVAEGDNDENSEEGNLWKVIEGSSVTLSDVA